MPKLKVDNLSCEFETEEREKRGLEDISFSVKPNGCVCIIGRSGVGKSTLLRVIAGLHPAGGGTKIQILHDDSNGTDDRKLLTCVSEDHRDFLPPHDRNLGYSFQKGRGLQPRKSVRQNILFPLTSGTSTLSAVSSEEKEERVRKIAEEFWLCEAEAVLTAMIEEGEDAKDAKEKAVKEFLEKKVGRLSGGQRQRVALARAFVVPDRDAYLLDEPFSGQDNPLRQKLLLSLRKKINQDAKEDTDGPAYVIVTHSQSEALGLADKILVLEPNGISEKKTPVVAHSYQPEELYTAPRRTTTASFIGDPCMNFLLGSIEKYQLSLEGIDISRDNDWLRDRLNQTPASTISSDERGKTEILVGIRPEDAELQWEAGQDPERWEFKTSIVHHRFEGEEYIFELDPENIGGLHSLSGSSYFQVQVHRWRGEEILRVICESDADATVYCSWPREVVHFFSPHDGLRLTADDDQHCS